MIRIYSRAFIRRQPANLKFAPSRDRELMQQHVTRGSTSVSVHLVLIFLIGVVRSDGSELRTVALSGQTAPSGTGEQQLNTFGAPVLNEHGRTAFRGAMKVGVGGVTIDNDTCIWSEGDNGLKLVVREQSPAAGTDSTFKSFSLSHDPLINSVGDTAFRATVNVPPVAGYSGGFWVEHQGSLALVAHAGYHPPATPPETVFDNVPYGNYYYAFNDLGHVVLEADTDPSRTQPGNTRGMWKYVDGALSPLVVENLQSPTMIAGIKFSNSLGWVVLNDSSQTAFIARLSAGEGGVTNNNDEGLWRGDIQSPHLVAREGDQAAGVPSGVSYGSFANGGIGFNRIGQTAFIAYLQGDITQVTSANDSALWSEGGGTLHLVAREGTHAPGTPDGTYFADFDEDFVDSPTLSSIPVLNSAGRIAFFADLKRGAGGVTAANDLGIWYEESGTLTMLARTGERAPGTPAGVVFDSFGLEVVIDSYVGEAAINSAGQIAFLGTLRSSDSSVTPLNDAGIWAMDRNGVLQLIAREGNKIDVDNGPTLDLRTISTLSFRGGGSTEDGRRSAFNDLGQLAFQATFVDGTAGIFVSNLVAVPESTNVLLGISWLSIFLSHRKRKSALPRSIACFVSR